MQNGVMSRSQKQQRMPLNNLGPWGTAVFVGAEAEEACYACAKIYVGQIRTPPPPREGRHLEMTFWYILKVGSRGRSC